MTQPVQNRTLVKTEDELEESVSSNKQRHDILLVTVFILSKIKLLVLDFGEVLRFDGFKLVKII